MSEIYSAIESIDQEPTIPTGTICDVLDVSRSAYYAWLTGSAGRREHITLVTKAAPDLGRVKADPTQIGQIILNLAVNAHDAMANGGDW